LAFFVALLLVVQALFSGLSIGARAADATSPIGVLCTRDGPGTNSGTPDPASHSATDCCTFGCSMVGGAAAPVPDETASVPAGIRLASAAFVPDAPPTARSELYPRHARAPPGRI
jgi:hypothetical protein